MTESLKVPKKAAGRHPKPPEGTWTEHDPELDTAPVSYESSISPEFFELCARVTSMLKTSHVAAQQQVADISGE